MNRKELLYRFFEVTGDEKDSLVYLKKFRESKSGAFALLYCTPDCFIETGETLLFYLRLMQGLELYPILLIDDTVIEYLNIFYGKLINLGNKFEENLINLRVIDRPHNPEIVVNSIKEKKIPVLLINKNIQQSLFTEVSKVISEIKIEKFIYLSPERMFLSPKDDISISIINFSNHNDLKIKLESFRKIEIEIINNFKYILEYCKNSLRSISVTTPISLFKELFTIKGSGTFFKLGSKIEVLDPDRVDKDRLVSLLETAFQKKIRYEFFQSKIDTIILESEYRGAAILRRTSHGVLLSKFAVDEIARGEGIGRELWDRMRKEFEKIFWRANKKNPINKWYIKECDGMIKSETWNYFWIGISPKNIEKVIEYLVDLPIDFYERDDAGE